MNDAEAAVAQVQAIEAIPAILELLCQSTGMRFAAVARVTEDRWIACGVLDRVDFGLKAGGELQVETTICHEVRQAQAAVYIDHVAQNASYAGHPTPRMYGFQSYISEPILLKDGTFFGTLCSIDPEPAKVDNPQIRSMFKLYAQLIAFHLQASTHLAAGEEIRRSAAFTSGVLASSPDCIKVLSIDGIVEYMNERGVLLNQFDSDADILGKDFASGWPAEEQGKVRDAIAAAAGGQTSRMEGCCPTAKGVATWWEATFTSFTTESGQRKIVGISRDITSRIQADALNAAAARRIEDLNATLELRVAERTAALELSEAALRQSQKMEAVGQLTGGIAHDFNNLLTGISGSLELLKIRTAQGRTGAELDRYVEAAQGAARRAAALTHRLLAFARRQTLDARPTDINRLTAEMEELLRRTLGPQVELEFAGATGLWNALVDANQLENAVLNLCINARDAMPAGGRVTIETANRWMDERAGREHGIPAGQYVLVSVSDTGTGMTKDVIERAFDPFFTTKPLGEGTGLGLSMVHGFAQQSGGQIRVYSELGHGTTFSIYLPRFVGDAGVKDVTDAGLDLAPSSIHETILVVDDEPTVRMLVLEVLADFGYVGIEAADGVEGLRVLQSDRRVDLLITDVGLPGGMNGRQVADAGRALRPDLRILFITGYADNAVVGNGVLDAGMEILTKPFAVETLAHRIKALVTSKPPPRPARDSLFGR